MNTPMVNKVISSQKFHKWDRDNNVLNHRTFSVDSSFNLLTSELKSTHSTITIRNDIIDAPTVNGGSVEFKDPWLIDSNDAPYGMRNQGMSAPFKPRTSPFYPNLNTSYNGDVYKGVFLNQRHDVPNPVYYSVRVPQTQTIGSYQNCNFIEWSATGNTQVVNPTSLESPVIFKGSNDVVKARYKGHRISSKSTATANNNQRKMVRDGSGVYHMVYE